MYELVANVLVGCQCVSWMSDLPVCELDAAAAAATGFSNRAAAATEAAATATICRYNEINYHL